MPHYIINISLKRAHFVLECILFLLFTVLEKRRNMELVIAVVDSDIAEDLKEKGYLSLSVELSPWNFKWLSKVLQQENFKTEGGNPSFSFLVNVDENGRMNFLSVGECIDYGTITDFFDSLPSDEFDINVELGCYLEDLESDDLDL